MTRHTFAAVDLGASGGRVMRGTVDDEHVTLEPVHRFPNGAVDRDGHLRWDLTGLFREVAVGLARLPDAESIGIDTWGVDYGLLDGDGQLLAEPIAYRDDRTADVIGDVHALIAPDELFAINGLQFLPITTIYQLAAERRRPTWDAAAHAVLLPDLLAYWLTGELGTEVTNASTTGLLDVRTRTWSTEVQKRLDLPTNLFPPLQHPRERRGTTASGTPVVTVGSHDTASAVAGVPATTDHFAYVACGTWALVGLELPTPVLTEAARRTDFTNELGVDDRTRFLHNVTGLWLLQECLRAWQHPDLAPVLADAATVPAGGPIIDVDDPQFLRPGAMPARIIRATGRAAMSQAEITRCIIDSLAAAFASRVRQAEDLAGLAVDVIHVVGGGSQNELLCQLTADAADLPVVAGPAEATALGNVLVQARAADAVPDSLEATRALIATSVPRRRYEPR
jgi:rhamnulokinase